MTATTKNTPATKNTPMTRDEVKKLLLDAAYVLHLTRRVKAEMIADRAEAAKADAPKSPETLAGLGV